MEHLPVEIIGSILSRVGCVRYVIRASLTCRKWLTAYRQHLRALSFYDSDFPHNLRTSYLEMFISQTIFQTTGLQDLEIWMHCSPVSASIVMAWLMHTRGTLCHLSLNIRTNPNINVLDFCGREKLEVLNLSNNSILGVHPNFQFPCLRSLTLSKVSISALDLRLFLSLCPKLETLELIRSGVPFSDPHAIVELRNPILKNVYIEMNSFVNFILEADSIEYLHLRNCSFQLFKLIVKSNLKHFKMAYVIFTNLDIKEAAENLEILDINYSSSFLSKLYQVTSKSSKLRRLRLWNFTDHNLEDEMEENRDSSILESVAILELHWQTVHDRFWEWVEVMLTRCPNVRKLIIGVVKENHSVFRHGTLASFNSLMIQFARKHIDLDVQFVNEY